MKVKTLINIFFFFLIHMNLITLWAEAIGKNYCHLEYQCIKFPPKGIWTHFLNLWNSKCLLTQKLKLLDFIPHTCFCICEIICITCSTGDSMWKYCITNPCFLTYRIETTFVLFHSEEYIFKNQVSKRAEVPIFKNLETSLASRIISHLCANHISFYSSWYLAESLWRLGV